MAAVNSVTQSLSIQIITRDRPSSLSRLIQGTLSDLRNERSDYAITVVDDSTSPDQWEVNRRIVDDTRAAANVPVTYVNRIDIISALSSSSRYLPPGFKSLVGILGDSEYCPARARNIARLLSESQTCEILLDDDVLIQTGSETSAISNLAASSVENRAFVSWNLAGVPDLSLLGLLEYVLVDGEESLMRPWTKDYSGYHLSGGCLCYPSNAHLPLFPSVYNEDFVWVAYCSNKFTLGRLKTGTAGEVKHLPDKPKEFSLPRLVYEAKGELLVAVLEQADLIALAERPLSLDLAQEREAVVEYKAYVGHLLSSLSHRQLSSPSVPWLSVPCVEQASEILTKFLHYLDTLPAGTIVGLYESWMQEILFWEETADVRASLRREIQANSKRRVAFP